MNQIRVIIADDHSLFREGIRALLKTVPEFVVINEASTGIEAIQCVEDDQPHVVLMDILMPELNGLDATARIVAKHPDVRVLILSMHDSEQYVYEAFRSGASGYMQKNANLVELELAIRTVAYGKTFLGASISRHVTEGYLARISERGHSVDRLTPRQRQVLQLIAEGRRTKEIASKLGVSVKTVEVHRAQTMQALDIHNVPGLVRYAIRVGMISADT